MATAARNGIIDRQARVVKQHPAKRSPGISGVVIERCIEGAFSLFKRGILGIYHSVSPKHLQRYCNEFSYRYNSRKITDQERFHGVLINNERRLKYADLIGR